MRSRLWPLRWHRSYPTLAQLADQAEALSVRAGKLKSDTEGARERAEVLRLQLAAIDARIAMLRGQTLPFDREAKVVFDTERLPDTDLVQRSKVRGQIELLLSGSNAVRGASSPLRLSLADRYAAYDRQFLIPADRLAPVMQAALAVCREYTLKHLPLPAGEKVELGFVRNQPWSAFSRYKGQGRSTISLNLDFPITVDDALELACHEGYPGPPRLQHAT